jgi:hypothetical protein
VEELTGVEVTPESKGVNGRNEEQEQEPSEEKPGCGHDFHGQRRRIRIRRGALSNTRSERKEGVGDHGPRSGDCGISHTQND